MAEYPGANVEYTAVATPTCVAGTPATAYTLTAVPVLATTFLWAVNIRIPPGPSGLTGIALVDGGSFILPYSQGAASWVTDDDAQLNFPYGKQVGSLVQLATYNTGTFNHTWQVRFTYTPMSALDEGGDVIITPDVTDWLAEITSA